MRTKKVVVASVFMGNRCHYTKFPAVVSQLIQVGVCLSLDGTLSDVYSK